MKNIIMLTTFVLSNLLMVCNAQNSNQISVKDSLISKLIKTSELESSKTNGKIIILETEYCQDFDCETYFQDYQDQIQIFSMEDAFMRGITNYIEIEKIDEEKGQILLSQRKGDEYKEIEINL
ncbi:MAG: hypothetical protein WBP08_05940 [Saprospiraceae bacterium]